MKNNLKKNTCSYW